MINCFNCYRLHKQEGIYYCPFIGLQPCVRGLHYFNADEVRPSIFAQSKIADARPPQTVAKPVKVKVNIVPERRGVFPKAFFQNPPPEFIPAKSKGSNVINYEPYHERIFEMIREGCSLKKISQEIGIKAATIRAYLARYHT